MAITQRYSTNAAIQYNESLADYLIADNATDKKFLTNAPLNRLIRENELSALYFLIDDAGFNGATILRFKDEDGNILLENNTNIATTHNIHNGLLVGFSGVPYFVPENTRKICALISGSPNLFLNPDFSQGSGNLFTSWTLTQPSRTNHLQYPNDYTQAIWTKANLTISGNKLVESAGVSTKSITQSYSVVANTRFTWGVSLKADGRNFVRVVMSDNSTGQAVVDVNLAAGTISGTAATGSWTLPDAQIVADGDYWRVRISATKGAGSAVLARVNLANPLGTISYNGDGTSGVLMRDAQLEDGSYMTPFIPTTTAAVTTSLGEFLQDATGGIDGGRCLKMWASTGSTSLTQSRFLTNGVQYKVSFWARVDKLYGNDYLTGPADASLLLSTEWTYYEQIPFTQVGTGTEVLLFDYTNDANYGFVYLDKMSIVNADENALTEERCFELDTRCFANENQIQWINKLGGVDTWTFTGNPIETRNTEREGLVEYPMQDNYQAPNEIYAYRSIKSHEVMNLFHRCDNEETAIWLRSELQDCIQAYLKIGDDFHPIIPTTSSVQLRNYAQRDPNVRFSFRFAYDINIQRR